MYRIYVVFDNGEVTTVDRLADAEGLDFLLVQRISGENVRWYSKTELTKELYGE